MAKNMPLRFYQLQDGYRYNSDSLLLVDFASNIIAPKCSKIKKPKKILDVGAGWIIGMLCTQHFATESSLIEINSTMAKLARHNVHTNFYHKSQSAISIPPMPKIYQADFLDPNIAHILEHKKFDFLITNPPFYREGALISENTFLREARYASVLPPDRWIVQSKKILAPRGGLIFCYHPDDLATILALLQKEGFTCEMLRLVYPLLSRKACLALLFARLNSKTPLSILPPLITHNSSCQSDFTQEVAHIYATYKTHSIKVFSSDIVEAHLAQPT